MLSGAAGGVTTGGKLSLTVKVFVAVPMFPQTSAAVKVTSTDWLQLLTGAVQVGVTVLDPLQPSLALAVAAHVATVEAL
jgi:hypothetical protein